jgi:glutathione S-transferase
MNDNLSYVLYGFPQSGNAYKTALMLLITGTTYEFEPVDLMSGGNLNPEYLEINPL